MQATDLRILKTIHDDLERLLGQLGGLEGIGATSHTDPCGGGCKGCDGCKGCNNTSVNTSAELSMDDLRLVMDELDTLGPLVFSPELLVQMKLAGAKSKKKRK